MRDRLRSLKFFRNMRNVAFCLCTVSLLQSLFLLINFLIWGHNFLISGLSFLVLAIFFGFLAYYYHGRFRCRE